MPLGSSCLSAQSFVPALQRDRNECIASTDRPCYVIKTDVTYTVTHQTTQILPPAGPPKRSRRERHEAVRTAARTLPIMTSGEGVLRWVTPRGPAASDATFGCGRARTSACPVSARPDWGRALLYNLLRPRFRPSAWPTHTASLPVSVLPIHRSCSVKIL